MNHYMFTTLNYDDFFHHKTENVVHVLIKNAKLAFKPSIVLSLKMNIPGSVIVSGRFCTNVSKSRNCINRCSGMCVLYLSHKNK